MSFAKGIQDFRMLTLFGVILAGIAWTPAIWAFGNYYGPKYEGQPITSVKLMESICDEGDVIAVYEVEKHHGRYLGLKFEVVGKHSERHEVWWNDENNWPLDRVEDRPVGTLSIGPIRVESACEKDYYLTTYHHSDWGWWTFKRTFGPFSGRER